MKQIFSRKTWLTYRLVTISTIIHYSLMGWRLNFPMKSMILCLWFKLRNKEIHYTKCDLYCPKALLLSETIMLAYVVYDVTSEELTRRCIIGLLDSHTSAVVSKLKSSFPTVFESLVIFHHFSSFRCHFKANLTCLSSIRKTLHLEESTWNQKYIKIW